MSNQPPVPTVQTAPAARLIIPAAIFLGDFVITFLIVNAAAPDLGPFLAGAIALLVAALTLYVYARAISSATATNQILVERPLPQVFDFVATNYFANRPKWSNLADANSEIIISEQTTPGPIRAGAAGRLVIGQPTRDQQWRVNIREYVVNHEFVVRTTTVPPAIETVMSLTFTATPTGTQLTIEHRMTLPPLQGLLNGFWSATYQQTMNATNALLKSAIELNVLPT